MSCAIATVGAWFFKLPWESIVPASAAFILGIVGICREPRGRVMAIVALFPAVLILAFLIYFVVLTYSVFGGD
jgi:hypothetical protein